MRKASIVVVGSANSDMVVRVPRLPRPGETLLGGEFTTAAGGKGANQAVAAARAGAAVTFVARVGSDALGAAARHGLERDGIDIRFVASDPRAPSGVALIFVGARGENCIAVAGGANLRLTPADVRRADLAIASADIMLVQLESPLRTVQAAIERARHHGVPVILNPAPATELSDAMLRRVSILTPNEAEAGALTGTVVKSAKSAERAARLLRERGVRTVVMTLGARGAYIATDSGNTHVPGFEVDARDTTAAGDVFNGALAVALGEGRPLPDAVRFANAAAALSVTRTGAQPSVPRRRAIVKFLGAW